MSVTESGPDLTSEVVVLLLDTLVVALSQRGLAAERRGSRMVSAKSRLARRQSGDSLVSNPELGQTVICLPDRIGRLSWFWIRSEPTGDATADLEYLGPAAYIGATADRITCALGADRLGLDLAI
jgi:hypothetical protein